MSNSHMQKENSFVLSEGVYYLSESGGLLNLSDMLLCGTRGINVGCVVFEICWMIGMLET